MVDACKLQFLLTPQASKISTLCTNRDSTTNFSKKRIGCYSYYLNDCIGSGYSSNVYKAYKNDNKDTKYAIKVIKLSKMSKGNYQLLQNQISILKQLDHPNIIKMHEVFNTKNNCYIVTDYCQGGTLQGHIQKKQSIDWKQIFEQIMEGCKYLEEKLVIHRDIKPANIFLKGNLWKIGDFGFARYVPYKSAQIKQMYMVGSPLYMPPQTLQKNIYSLKTDSFALGILFFHLVTTQFPWSGNNKKQLIQNYASKKYPLQKIKDIPEQYQRFLKGLCQIQISRRYYISDFQELKVENNYLSRSTQATNQVQQDLVQQLCQDLFLDVVQQMKLCKFVFFIDVNIQHLPDMCRTSQSLRRMLKLLVSVFRWLDNPSYKNYIDQFLCRNYKQFSRIGQLRQFNNQLYQSIDNLEQTSLRRCQVLRIKLIQLFNIIKCILVKDLQNLKISVANLVLHADFSKVLISPAQVCQIQKLKTFDI